MTGLLKEESEMAELAKVSESIVHRLMTDADFRLRFQKDPAQCLRECGVPDLIGLGQKVGQYRYGDGVGAIAVACVVI